MNTHAPRKPQPRPEILAIDPYVPGKSKVAGLEKAHKLSSNESPLGPSRKAIDAVKAHADSLELYPDGASTALREAIGRRYGLDPARIICGNGSDELLALLAQPPEERAALSLAAIMRKLDEFVGGAPQHDDITCLVVRRA